MAASSPADRGGLRAAFGRARSWVTRVLFGRLLFGRLLFGRPAAPTRAGVDTGRLPIRPSLLMISHYLHRRRRTLTAARSEPTALAPSRTGAASSGRPGYAVHGALAHRLTHAAASAMTSAMTSRAAGSASAVGIRSEAVRSEAVRSVVRPDRGRVVRALTDRRSDGAPRTVGEATAAGLQAVTGDPTAPSGRPGARGSAAPIEFAASAALGPGVLAAAAEALQAVVSRVRRGSRSSRLAMADRPNRAGGRDGGTRVTAARSDGAVRSTVPSPRTGVRGTGFATDHRGAVAHDHDQGTADAARAVAVARAGDVVRAAESAWRGSVTRQPLETPTALPARWIPLVRSLTGRSHSRYTTGSATRRALSAAGALGATTGTTLHLSRTPTDADLPVLAHELAHSRTALTRPRFLLSHAHGGADADERQAHAMAATSVAAGAAGAAGAAQGVRAAAPDVGRLPVTGMAGVANAVSGLMARTTQTAAPGDLRTESSSGVVSGGGSGSGGVPNQAGTGSDTERTATGELETREIGASGQPGPGGSAGTPAGLDLDQLVESLEVRLIRELERRGGRFAEVF